LTKVCNEKCAQKFLPFVKNISSCAPTTTAGKYAANPSIKALSKSCKKIGTSHNKTSCSSRAVYPFMIECSKFVSEALKDGKLDSSDHFCTSPCYTESLKFQKCKDKGTQMFTRSINALQSSDAGCKANSSSKPTLTGLQTKIQTNCAAQSATQLTPGSCKNRCFGIVRYAMANNYSKQVKAMPTYKKLNNLIKYCNANRTNSECKSAKNMALNQVMVSCCGKQAKKCAAGHLPSNCTSQCSGSFLPYYSSCGRTVFKGTQLKSMVNFARTCAKQNGRYVAPTRGPSQPLNGPNPNDFCSRISNCTQCHGKCGWCRNEVQNRTARHANHGGWCSSICTTSNGECTGRTGFGAHTLPPNQNKEIGKQCFDMKNNDGNGGTDCEDCDCIQQFRSYCTRKLKLQGKTAPTCRGGKGGSGTKGSGKGGSGTKGSGKGGSGKGASAAASGAGR